MDRATVFISECLIVDDIYYWCHGVSIFHLCMIGIYGLLHVWPSDIFVLSVSIELEMGPVQIGIGILLHSLCESSCPLRTVHSNMLRNRPKRCLYMELLLYLRPYISYNICHVNLIMELIENYVKLF